MRRDWHWARRSRRLRSALWLALGMATSSLVLLTPWCAHAQVVPINTSQPIKHEEIQMGWVLASQGVCPWHCYATPTQISIIAAAAASLGIIAGPLSPWAGFIYGNIANIVVRDSFARIQALCRERGCIDGATTWEVLDLDAPPYGAGGWDRPPQPGDRDGLPQDPGRPVLAP